MQEYVTMYSSFVQFKNSGQRDYTSFKKNKNVLFL